MAAVEEEQGLVGRLTVKKISFSLYTLLYLLNFSFPKNFLFCIGVTNLDSILKSRDVTLPTKVRLVKAMVFPVVMYGCESWTVKKAEC